MRRIVTILMACAIAAGASAEPGLEQEAREFLARYIALGEAYDPAVAELYADHAVIKAYRRYPHGLERAMEMRGVAWKELIRTAMPWAKAQNDRSEFRAPEFQVDEGRVKTKANRYSFRKCYLDTGYYMILARQPDGSLRIVEEYTETQPQSDCRPAPASADPVQRLGCASTGAGPAGQSGRLPCTGKGVRDIYASIIVGDPQRRDVGGIGACLGSPSQFRGVLRKSAEKV